MFSYQFVFSKLTTLYFFCNCHPGKINISLSIHSYFVESACGELDLVATFGGSLYVRACVRACVRPDLSRLYLAHSLKDYKIIWYKYVP